LRILISAGEASGDLYASALAAELSRRRPGLEFFGCTGAAMRAAGVETVVDAAQLNVVGLIEVVQHIPRIYGEFRRLVSAARARKPDLAILTDAPDFHLRLAKKLRSAGIPVVYLVAPQVWAWRKGRIPAMRRDLEHLLCIFPFEEEFFRSHGVASTYIGHPLTRIVKPTTTAEEFRRRHGIEPGKRIVTLLPGSRPGEIGRHLRVLPAAVQRIAARADVHFVLATPPGLRQKLGLTFFTEPIGPAPIQHIEGETWDAIAHAEIALAASGTVTIEATLLGTPMAAFYEVSPLSWWMGRYFVNVPFFSMVNLVAGRRIVPELIQRDCTPDGLAAEALRLLEDAGARDTMKRDLLEVSARLSTPLDPMERAAGIVIDLVEGVKSK
jgi:lipid-A-disaccharide synthase